VFGSRILILKYILFCLHIHYTGNVTYFEKNGLNYYLFYTQKRMGFYQGIEDNLWFISSASPLQYIVHVRDVFPCNGLKRPHPTGFAQLFS